MLKKFLDQFRNLNTRDPGAWPPAPKAGLLIFFLVGILAMGYFLDWQEEWDSLEAGRAQEIKLKDEYVQKQQQANNDWIAWQRQQADQMWQKEDAARQKAEASQQQTLTKVSPDAQKAQQTARTVRLFDGRQVC